MNLVETGRSNFRAPIEDEMDIGLSNRSLDNKRALDFIRIWRIALKHKWVVIGSVVTAILIGLVLTMLATRLYTANTTIEIQRESRNFTNVEGAQSQQSMVDQEFYQTQFGLLKSQSLAERVATELKLFDSPAFFTLMKSPRAEQWFSQGRPTSNAAPREQRIRETAGMLLGGIEVTPQRASRLVTLEYTSPDAAFSQRVANSWAKAFIEATLDRRYETTSYARQFLEERLNQLRTRIDESQHQLVVYAGREGIINVPSGARQADGGTIEQPLIATDLASLNAELSRATADRILAESRRGLVTINSDQNAALSSLRDRRAGIAADYAKMIQQYEPQYQPAQALQNQLSQIDRDIKREENRGKESLEETYRASVEREQNLKNRVAQLKGDFIDTRRRSIQYDILQREVDTNQQLYAALLQRYKEIGVAGGVGVNNISVVDKAQLPGGPSSPRLFVNLAIALLVGLFAGAAITLLLEQMDQAVADPAEVPVALGVPLLGAIPKLESGRSLIEVLDDRKGSISESYFSLLTTLRFSTDHGFPKSLMVSSSRAAEGKSSTSYALAKVLANSNRKVVLVDADMRSPSQHSLLNKSAAKGLSDYLTGEDDLNSLIQTTSIDGLYLLAAGPQPPSAAELLASERLQRLIDELGERFDNVIVDAPPVMGMADAPLIGSRVEGAVFVIQAHSTSKGAARVAVSRLRSTGTTIFGALLAKFDTKRAEYGYGYDYGYGYGYGDTAERKT